MFTPTQPIHMNDINVRLTNLTIFNTNDDTDFTLHSLRGLTGGTLYYKSIVVIEY